jgi:hypothetical protein
MFSSLKNVEGENLCLRLSAINGLKASNPGVTKKAIWKNWRVRWV